MEVISLNLLKLIINYYLIIGSVGIIYYLYKVFLFCLISFYGGILLTLFRRNKTKNRYFKTLTNKFNIMTPQKENIYLNRLKEQYIYIEKCGSKYNKQLRQTQYFAMRLFCLDTKLVSFNDIEVMEYEVNQSF